MKTIISMLTASVMFSLLLTGCGTAAEQNSQEETLPDLQIAAIPIETQKEAAPVPDLPSETVLLTEAAETLPEEIIPEMLPTEETPQEPVSYNTAAFDKAIFGAMLDAVADKTQYYFVSDPDRDGMSEMLITLPDSETSSRNVIMEGLNSAGIYYYAAAGAENDFFVLDPSTGDVYLNENTRSQDGESIISREYFQWTGSQWQSACMLYNGACYWNYEPTSVEQFLANADAMLSITPPEDIFNMTVSGTPEQAADAFYDYLSDWFSLERPVAADIDGDGSPEQVLCVQNLSKRWCADIRNLYQTESFFDAEKLNAIHTTCFVLDAVNGRTRIRSQNFDRKYRFAQSGGRLFAYDDTNTTQTVQYSKINDGFGKYFLSMTQMMN